MRTRKSQIKRIKEFIDMQKDMKNEGWLDKLIISSGIMKYYEDKYRELLYTEGTNPHPYPEERL
tara:strand:- start:274 stop:465 length:192 start_codon:yes stop_codon:yes gene_type:complete